MNDVKSGHEFQFTQGQQGSYNRSIFCTDSSHSTFVHVGIRDVPTKTFHECNNITHDGAPGSPGWIYVSCNEIGTVAEAIFHLGGMEFGICEIDVLGVKRK